MWLLVDFWWLLADLTMEAVIWCAVIGAIGLILMWLGFTAAGCFSERLKEGGAWLLVRRGKTDPLAALFTASLVALFVAELPLPIPARAVLGIIAFLATLAWLTPDDIQSR
jgi:hypothetical protein